jgi:hypothetical protein
MGGQPWPLLELHGRPWGARRRGKRGGRRRGVGGAAWGQHGEAEGCRRGLLVAAWLGPLLVWPLCSLEKAGRRREEREEKEREGKEEEKGKNGKNL